MLAAARSPHLHLVAGAAVSGVASYVYLAIVARALTLGEYAQFSFFWSCTVLVGLGVFLPVEQELARQESHPLHDGPRNARRIAVVVGGVAGAVATGVVLGIGAGFAGADPALVGVGVGAAAAASTFQVALRGALGGSRLLSRYALLLGIEGVLRVALPLVLLLFLPHEPLAFALVLAVAAAVSLAAGVGVRFPAAPRTTRREMTWRIGRLVSGAVFVQILVNFAPIVAFLSASDVNPGAAGVILAAVTLGRIPIFIYQSVQTAVIPTIAAAARRGDVRSARRIFGALVGGTGLLGVAWTVALSIAGAPLLALMFGPAFRISPGELALVAASMSAMLLGMAISDSTMAVGGHSFIAVVWALAACFAAVAVVVLPDIVPRSTLPVIVAGVGVAVVLTIVFLRRTRPGGERRW